MNLKLKILLILYIIFFFISCDSSSVNSDNQNKEKDNIPIISLCENPKPQDNIQRGSLISYKILKEAIANTTYSLVYYSKDHNNKFIKVSGYASVPNYEDPINILQFNRGTSDRENPPSEGFGLSEGLSQAVGILQLLVNTPFAIVIPDYQGYGVSNDVHPYGTKHIAHASVDIIRAFKHLLKKINRKVNNKIYLGGYSEGGQATMATHEQINTCYKDEINVVASVPMAGPYDALATINRAFKNGIENYPHTKNIIYYIFSYIYVYNDLNLLNISLKEPYKSEIKKLIQDKNPVGLFDINVPSDGKDFFKISFIDDMINGNIDKNFKENLLKNNTFKWNVPSGKMRLYHSPDDLAVPYINSSNAIAYFKSKNIDVRLVDVPGNHLGAAVPSILQGLNWLLDQ
jgi:hypothetical protein